MIQSPLKAGSDSNLCPRSACELQSILWIVGALLGMNMGFYIRVILRTKLLI